LFLTGSFGAVIPFLCLFLTIARTLFFTAVASADPIRWRRSSKTGSATCQRDLNGDGVTAPQSSDCGCDLSSDCNSFSSRLFRVSWFGRRGGDAKMRRCAPIRVSKQTVFRPLGEQRGCV